MEQPKKNSLRDTFRKANRIYYRFKNLYTKGTNVEFREFQIMEYASVRPEELTDLKRLTYLKTLDLAKNGYINNDLKNLLAHQKEKLRLMNNDQAIIPVGHIRVNEKELFLKLVHIGFEPKNKTLKVAYANHDNIPKWKNLDSVELSQTLAQLYPKESNSLRFDHSFFAKDLSHLTDEDLQSVIKGYDLIISEAFGSNKYFKNAILVPTEEVLKKPQKHIGKQFRLEKEERAIMTLTEANDQYLVFQPFLTTAPNTATKYFTQREFKQRFLNNQIEVVAFLKFGLILGLKNGSLYIGRNSEGNHNTQMIWERFQNILASQSITAKTKYYLSKEVISNKNFVVEEDAIVLEFNSKIAHLKKHYGTGEWRFAVEYSSNAELNFRPLDKKAQEVIINDYSQSPDIHKALKLFIDRTQKRMLQIKQSQAL